MATPTFDRGAQRARARELISRGGLSLDRINQALRAEYGQGIRKQDLAALRRVELELPPPITPERYTPRKYLGPKIVEASSLTDGRQNWDWKREYNHYFTYRAGGHKRVITLGTNDLPKNPAGLIDRVREILEQNAEDYADIPYDGGPITYLYTLRAEPGANAERKAERQQRDHIRRTSRGGKRR